VELLTLRLKLSGLAFTLRACENTDQAKHFIEACRPGVPAPRLIVLDLHIPPENGEAVFRAIRANADLRRTPVLIMTTSAAPSELNVFRSEPFTRVTTKPGSLKEYDMIVETITTLLKGDAAPEKTA
jgi:CheY-like chemotaxis protein